MKQNDIAKDHALAAAQSVRTSGVSSRRRHHGAAVFSQVS
jgi:hypothetical protein